MEGTDIGCGGQFYNLWQEHVDLNDNYMEEDKEAYFAALEDKIRSNGLKLQEVKFQSNIRRKFLIVGLFDNETWG